MVQNRVKFIFSISLLAGLLLLLAACTVTSQAPEATAPPPPEETVVSTEEPVEEPTDVAQDIERTGFEDLVEALLLSGYAVELGGSIEQPFFSSQGQILLVDGGEVQVFEYADDETAAAEAAQIAPGAGSVGTSMMTWVATPHFYAQDNIIALYVGDDEHVIEGLNGVLGQPVAEGQGQSLLPPADTVEVLSTALSANDYAALQGLMSDPFTIGYWQSQGQVLTPAEAEELLRLNLLPNPAAVSFVRDPAQFPDLGEFDPYSAFGPDAHIIDLVYSQGWGGDGLGEAILMIDEDAEGEQHWRGIIYGLAGFSALMAPPPVSTLPFEPAVYRNEENGFEFDYPASWAYEEEVLGSRASGAQFMSEGETVMSAVVYLWDPNNDLDGFIDRWRQGMSSSDITILSEDEMTLAGDRRAVQIVFEDMVDMEVYLLFTIVGDNYLEIASYGNLQFVPEIAQTLRSIP